MDVILTKKPKSPVLIEGFPGFGMVGAIATEYLIQHLNTEPIGKILVEDMPAMVAVHEGKLMEPFTIYYAPDQNLLLLHAVAAQPGTEWKLSDSIFEICQHLDVKEIISLEGIGTNAKSEQVFYYASELKAEKKLDKLKYKPLDEGVILGITSALLIKRQHVPLTCLFAETHSSMPDSKGAAKLVEAVDRYLGLKVDTKPLLVMADIFEKKLKNILQQAQSAQSQSEKKAMDYVG